MSQYEFVYLLAHKEEESRIKEILTKNQVKILKEESLGEKKLAYPIKKKSQAFYFIYQIEIDKKNILELKKNLNFEEKLMRYLLLAKEK